MRRKIPYMKKKVDVPLDKLKEMLKDGDTISTISKTFGCDLYTIKNLIHENPDLLK